MTLFEISTRQKRKAEDELAMKEYVPKKLAKAIAALSIQTPLNANETLQHNSPTDCMDICPSNVIYIDDLEKELKEIEDESFSDEEFALKLPDTIRKFPVRRLLETGDSMLPTTEHQLVLWRPNPFESNSSTTKNDEENGVNMELM